MSDNIRVGVRVRPLGAGRGASATKLAVDPVNGKLRATLDAAADDAHAKEHKYEFTYVFERETNEMLFKEVGEPLVRSTMQGYNSTLFAYGQTGSGKTFTMGEISNLGTVNEGVAHRVVRELFRATEEDAAQSGVRYTISATYVQVYVEKIYDLLARHDTGTGARAALGLRDLRTGTEIQGAHSAPVATADECLETLKQGARNLSFASTQMNAHSSRSHAVCRLVVECEGEPFAGRSPGGGAAVSGATLQVRDSGHHDGVGCELKLLRRQSQDLIAQTIASVARKIQTTRSVLTLCDLAGSEDVGRSGATGQSLTEAKKINTSLLALGNVISSLTHAAGGQHVPFRDSVRCGRGVWPWRLAAASPMMLAHRRRLPRTHGMV